MSGPWATAAPTASHRLDQRIRTRRAHRRRGRYDSLRKVLGYVHADIVEEACTRIPVTRNDVGAGGTITDPAAREKIAETVAALARHVADRDTP